MTRVWLAIHRPLVQLGALHITSIYGRTVCIDRSVPYSHAVTVTHLLKNNVLLPVPARFLEEWMLQEGGVLKAPVEICARDLIVSRPFVFSDLLK